MADAKYTAAKARTQGRPGWTISFRHPLRNDTKGRPGLKMRRGLGTADPTEADKLVADMNAILSDQSWWNSSKKSEAERTFAPVVVAAFYDEIQAGRPDSWAVREEHVPLPTLADGYSRVLFVGTTGAGKTSLLRHMIGSDPDEDRFPSTSTAKTTIADIEVVLTTGDYSSVVTFFSEFWVQANVEECLADACSGVWEGVDDAKLADRLLNHRDQRFRLSYILGPWPEEDASEDDGDWSFGQNDQSREGTFEPSISSEERDANKANLRDYLAKLKDLAKRVILAVSSELGEDVLRLGSPDREAAQELFEWKLQRDDAFDNLMHDILDDIRHRFDHIRKGELIRHASGWPAKWTFQSQNRGDFIEQIRWFSSNYAPQFGRLLTPLVDGIRVSGPLFPTFTQLAPKVVLLDGQGLGHTPDSSASITTHITKRFADVDVVLLVDNAQQPMQAAPLSVVRALAASGHQQKLAIAFTHFDHVKGNNLPNVASKRAHVMASVTNALTSLRDVLGVPIARGIERNIRGHPSRSHTARP